MVWILVALTACKGPAPMTALDVEPPPAPVEIAADDAVWKQSGDTGALVVPIRVTNHLTRSIDLDVVSVSAGECTGQATVAERLLPGKASHLTVTIPCTRDAVGETVELSGVAIYETSDQKRTANASPTVRVMP